MVITVVEYCLHFRLPLEMQYRPSYLQIEKEYLKKKRRSYVRDSVRSMIMDPNEKHGRLKYGIVGNRKKNEEKKPSNE